MQADEINALGRLARLDISESTIEQTAKSISEILTLVDQLKNVDTDNIPPMAHPLDAVQILREDRVTETDRRTAFQAIAPSTEDGLYLVPKVIE